MKIPFKYTFKNFRTRKLTTFITITGIGLVVFVFSAVLMMAYGVEKTLISTGSDDNVIVLRKSASGEIMSSIESETQNIIKTLPHIAKKEDGSQILSPEPVVVINLEIRGGGMSNITVRGVTPASTNLRPQIKLIEGKMFKFGLNELIVGESISKRFEEAQIGKKINFFGNEWLIVGVFSSDGSGFDSEIHGDALQLLSSADRGNTVSTMTIKLDNPDNFDKFRAAFESDKRLQQHEVKSEKKFFEEQSQFLSIFIRIVGIFITVVFSLGSTIGAMITMYAAVSNRTVEIGTMRALGFGRRSIMIAFLFESILISLIGGGVGIILSSFLGYFKISTLNFNSFAEISFSFALSTEIVIISIAFALLMGVLGGFLPSLRAARLNIISALRSN